MANINVVIPRRSNIRQKVRDRYTELWEDWKDENPNSRAYPVSKLNQNIRRALSVNGRVLNEHYFENSRYNGWSGRKVLPWCHWYYLVRFQQDLFGNITAIIEDALYEGDYHNDTMNTKPYGESVIKPNFNLFIENNNTTNKFRNMNNKKVVRLTESQLHNIIAESVSQILNEIGDTPKGAYDLGRLYGRYKGRKLYSPSKENKDRISDMEKYIEAKKFDDVARRRAFDRGEANQRFATDFAFGIEDKKRGYDRMVNDRENADNLEGSFGGREFMDDWKPSR